MTLQQLWSEGTERLTEAGVSEAGLDARLLLLRAFRLDTAHFLLKRGEELSGGRETAEAVDWYRELIDRRARRVPLQHLTGRSEFMGLEFEVNGHVLIPRQDTETLVELVLSEIKNPGARLLDLCAGSGCIGVSLAVLGGFGDVTLTDVSVRALKTAEKNAARLSGAQDGVSAVEKRLVSEEPWELRVTSERAGEAVGVLRLLESDLFFGLCDGEMFDVIVSNPPYIATDIIESLEPEVREYEPRMALDGMEDGLYFYRRIAEESPRYLKGNGRIYLEIGCDQASAVTKLLAEAGFEHIAVIKDMPGLDRVVRAILPGRK